MSTLSDMMDALAPADDGNGYTITQRRWDEVIALLACFVTAYDAMPDGAIGHQLTNEPFIRAKQILARNAPSGAKYIDSSGGYWDEIIEAIPGSISKLPDVDDEGRIVFVGVDPG